VHSLRSVNPMLHVARLHCCSCPAAQAAAPGKVPPSHATLGFLFSRFALCLTFVLIPTQSDDSDVCFRRRSRQEHNAAKPRTGPLCSQPCDEVESSAASPKRRKADTQKVAGIANGDKDDGRREHGTEKMSKSEKGSKVEAKPNGKGLTTQKEKGEQSSSKADPARPKKRKEDNAYCPDERGAAVDKKDDKDSCIEGEKRIKVKGKSVRDMGVKTSSPSPRSSSHTHPLNAYQSGSDCVSEESSNFSPSVHPLLKLRCVF
jgi:hypothetical protein